MAQRKYDLDEVTFGGSVHVELTGVQKGDRVVATVEGVVRACEDKTTAHAGDKVVGKIRLDMIEVLSGAERNDFAQRFEARREKAGADGQQQWGEEYRGTPVKDLRALCKERGLNHLGTKDELIGRLVENDG